MYGTELYVAIVVGTILSLIYTEITGVLPAGLVVSGYLALILNQPYMVLMIILISCLTYLIVNYVISRFVILYGRRKFVAMITVAVIIKVGLDNLYPLVPFEIFQIYGIGVIVPGIIANTIERQGFAHTILSTLLVSTLTFLIISYYYLLT